MEVVYMELNNWFSGRDYPNQEPFISWLHDDCNIIFRSDEFAKKNKLVIVAGMIDMSQNFCITAPKDWVLENCPNILGFPQFIFDADENGDPPCGRFDTPFLEYKEENFGVHWYDEDEGFIKK